MTYTYDALGDTLTETDRNDTVHTYGYDEMGRQISDSASTKPSPSEIVASPITNGGFESGTTGWTFSSAGTMTAGSAPSGGDGSYVGYISNSGARRP